MRLPLRVAMVASFCGVVGLGVAGVLGLGLVGAERNTRELLAVVAVSLVDTMTRALAEQMEPVLDQASWIAERYRTGDVGLDDPDALDAFMVGTLAAPSQVSGLGLVFAPNTLRAYVRRDPGVHVVPLAPEDPSMVALQAATRTGAASWGAPVWSETLADTMLNRRTPLVGEGGTVRGLLIQGISVSDLSQALPRAAAGAFPWTPFIVYDDHWVLAHPLLASSGIHGRRGAPLARLSEFPDPVLAALWSSGPSELGIDVASQGLNGGVVTVGGERHFFLYRRLYSYADKSILVGLHINEEASVADVLYDRIDRVLALGLAALLVCLLAALALSRAIGRPILRLANAAAQVGRGELDAVTALPRSDLTEVDAAGAAFNRMVEGLKERRLVRALLGTYVPERVADQLIEGRGTLAPTLCEATVLFSDIAGFTSLTEALGPQGIVDVLNAYFTRLDVLLQAHGGVVTQFQGDAVLACFNVPVPDPDHARQAVQAGLAILEATERERFAGHHLPTRIGIASGGMVAGSVGAGDRLSYTVHGDAVNLAARLQALNKDYGTSILIAEATARRVPDMAFRTIGEVAVRGQSHPVRVVTVADGPGPRAMA